MAEVSLREKISTALFSASPGAHGRTFDRAQKRFAPCPDSPNCVSTQAPTDDPVHAIQPIPYQGPLAAAQQRLLSVLRAMPRVTLVAVEPDYLYAEFRSQLWHFVDDVEFYFDESAHQIHFRSSSRLGRGDLGVNRKRMETIRQRFAALG
ncbi:MAG: DUF1499 domain-containing protein [Caldilineaceae bacterium]|nr:DUF1499 domain-containing protein [Caldilineaceae bacterium]